MKFGKLFAMLAMVAVATTACQNEPENITPNNGQKEIAVSPSLAGFARATDTAFEEGDMIGLHIITETPWLDNALFTYTNGALTSVRPQYWYPEDVTSTVIGYYPYSSENTYKESYTFTVNADQSSHAKYTKSDLMVAITTAKPTSEAVELPFKHVLSKVVITVDNQLEGEVIDNVWFSEVYGKATLNLADGSVVATGEKGTFKTASVTTTAGTPAWAVILAPQAEVTPKLVITTKSEKQFTFELQGAVTFSSGKVSTANITLTDDSIYTDFTPTISDWVADNDLQFGQDPDAGGDIEGGDTSSNGVVYLHPGVWNVDGAWFSAHFWGSTDADVTLTDADGDGVFECPVPEGATNVLFCRMNPAFTSFGWDITEGETVVEDHVWNQSDDLTLGAQNHYFITDWGTEKSVGSWNDANYDPSADLAGKDSGLGIVGSFAASGWGMDVLLLTTETEGLLVAKGVAFKAGECFKIRTAGTWEGEVNLGTSSVNYIEADKFFTAADWGGDIYVSAAGTYDIYFNQNTKVVYLMTAGTAHTAATEQTANGKEPENEDVEVTENTIYFSTGSVACTGARFAAYFWIEGGSSVWVDMTDSDGDKIYEVNIPAGGYGEKVIFCNMTSNALNSWNNKVNQTADLIIPSDGKNLYTLGAWKENGGGSGTWSTK